MTTVDPQQPVVILGGFLITEEAYEPMAQWLKGQGVRDVLVVPMSKLDWLLTAWGFGWRRVLDRVEAMVKQLHNHSPKGKVTLIGHSSGGVMMRLYLSDAPFQGRVYNGAKRCNRLVTLGSPHQVKSSPQIYPTIGNWFARLSLPMCNNRCGRTALKLPAGCKL